MGINMEFFGGAKLTHMNVRKQGAENEKIVAVDLKLTGEVLHGPWLYELFLSIDEEPSYHEHLDALLWLDDEDENVRSLTLGPLQCQRVIPYAELHYAGMMKYCEAKKFIVSPRSGRRCEVSFQATLDELSASDISFLAEMLQEETHCQLIKTDLLDEEPADD